MSSIYSDDINCVCRLCVHASAVAGSRTHMRCALRGGYTPIGGNCDAFSYDVFKRNDRRKKKVSDKGFTADDFSL